MTTASDSAGGADNGRRPLASRRCGPSLDRLRRALEVREAFVSGGSGDVQSVLALHEDLHDLLEPLLLPDACLDDELPAAERVGEFTVLRELGRGGMGVVYEAEQPGLDRRVALKVLPLDRVEPRALARFRREAVSGGRLSHPSLISVISCGESAGRHWIAQELIPGGRTLEDFLNEARARRELDAGYYRDVARIIAEAAEGLAAAHAAGIVHRDVKPANLLLTEDDRAKVADFGLARLGDSITISRTAAWIGTPFYMSPEQCDPGAGEVGPASDQFALGATLYEALTLRRPFEGDTSQHVLKQVCEHDPPDPSQLHSGVPRDLAAICLRAIEKRPEARYPSIGEVAADLRRFLEGEPVTARVPGAARRLRRWARRHPTRVVAGGVAAVALLVVGALLLAVAQESLRAASNGRLADALGAQRRLGELRAEAAALWPLGPGLLERGDAWVRDAEELLARRPAHAAHLGELLGRAAVRDAGGAATFESPEDELAHRAVTGLLAALDDFGRTGGLLDEVRGRLSLVRELERRSLASDAGVEAWRAAQDAVAAHPAYGGLELRPQFGLLPLGPDPASGLWEFVHLATGEPPLRDPSTRRLLLRPDSGVVLVLLPSGSFLMGSQSDHPDQPRYQLPYNDGNTPVHERTVEPFLLSKYEMTQAQWERAAGENPSQFSAEEDSPLRPVEQVSWLTADLLLPRVGLRLPGEVEWEYACRAGTDTEYFFGDDAAGIASYANVKDRTNVGGQSDEPFDPVDDGHVFTAPVGSYLPNAFGLHDMHGNVAEWCADLLAPYPGGPLSPTMQRFAENRVHRGGGYHRIARDGRASTRGAEAPDFLYRALGVRPARSLERAE